MKAPTGRGALTAAAIWLTAGASVLAQPAQVPSPAPAREQPYSAQSLSDLFVARHAMRAGDFAEAARRFAALQRLTPDDPQAVSATVSASLAALQPEIARVAARAGDRHDAATHLAPQLVLAADALRDRRWRAAREAATAAAAGQGEQGMRMAALVILAWAQAGTGRTDEGVDVLDRMPRPSAFAASLHYQRAMMLEAARRNDQALEAYSHAYRASDPRAWSEALRYRAFIARTQPEALAGFDQTWAVRAQDSQASLDSLQAWEAPALTPARAAATAMEQLARMVRNQGGREQALRLLALGLALDPQAGSLLLEAAADQEALSKTQVARASLAQVSPTSPVYGAAQMRLARMQHNEGDPAGAQSRLEALVAERPTRRAQLELATQVARNGAPQEAQAIYAAVLAQDPQDWTAWLGLARARLATDDWPGAQRAFDAALALAPNNPALLNSYGNALVDRNESAAEGLAMARRALALSPNNGYFLDTVGWAYVQLGRPETAIGYLEAAVRAAPAEPTIVAHLGDAYWQVGRRTEARYQWRRAAQAEADPARRRGLEVKLEAGLTPSAVVQPSR